MCLMSGGRLRRNSQRSDRYCHFRNACHLPFSGNRFRELDISFALDIAESPFADNRQPLLLGDHRREADQNALDIGIIGYQQSTSGG
jgi:hypothetical protein